MIYIAAHKKFNDPHLDGYMPLQVGAEGKDDLGYLKDNSGDNISLRNPNYCELTGLYWIWKNTEDEYKGLVHYRRYFGRSNLSSRISDVWSCQALTDQLRDHDIVLPCQTVFLQNAREQRHGCCSAETFDRLRQVISDKYPDYLTDFDSFFAQNKCSLFNMMYCRRELFDAYCSWLFDILFELEKHVSLDDVNDYDKRLYGFLSERLINIWSVHNGLIPFYSPVIQTEMSNLEKIRLMRRNLTNNIRYHIRESGSGK